MKFVTKLILGIFGKITNVLIFIRYGVIKKELRVLKTEKKLKERADEIREDTERSSITDLREWLRKHKDR